jgi:molybdate transport system substrate-binding protein
MGWLGPIAPVLVILGLTAGTAAGAEIRVMVSSGFAAAFRQIAPEFERSTTHEVNATYGPSSGQGGDTLSGRLGHEAGADVLIMTRPALDDLVAGGKVDGKSRVDIARAGIGIVVRSGAAHPDISTIANLKAALLGARAIAVSDGLSGIYVAGPLLDRLGIAAAVGGKLRQTRGHSAAAAVARGEADIGFQTTSEMLATPEVDYLGPLPHEVQQMTVLTAALGTGAQDSEAAHALIDFLTSPAAVPVIMKTGLEPILDHGTLAAR